MKKRGRKKTKRTDIKLRRCLNNQEFAQLKKHLHLTFEEMAEHLGISVRYCQKLACVTGKGKPISRTINNSCMYLLSQNPVILPKEPELPK